MRRIPRRCRCSEIRAVGRGTQARYIRARDISRISAVGFTGWLVPQFSAIMLLSARVNQRRFRAISSLRGRLPG